MTAPLDSWSCGPYFVISSRMRCPRADPVRFQFKGLRVADGPYWPLGAWPASSPGQAVPVRRPPDPRRLEPDVRLVGIGRLLRRARAVARRELGHRVDDLPLLRPAADHEDHAWPVTRADEDVLGPRRTVEEVPRPRKPPLSLHS